MAVKPSIFIPNDSVIILSDETIEIDGQLTGHSTLTLDEGVITQGLRQIYLGPEPFELSNILTGGGALGSGLFGGSFAIPVTWP